MKAHLVNSVVPIVQGSAVSAVCGSEIPSCRIVFMWDDTIMGGDLRITAETCPFVCRKCIRESPPVNGYVYGVTEAKAKSEAA